MRIENCESSEGRVDEMEDDIGIARQRRIDQDKLDRRDLHAGLLKPACS